MIKYRPVSVKMKEVGIYRDMNATKHLRNMKVTKNKK